MTVAQRRNQARKRWVAKQKARGLCKSCTRPARPGGSRCEVHLEKKREADRRTRGPRFVVTRDMVLADVQAVARRLRSRIVTTCTYIREGSFCLTDQLRERIGAWSDLCVEAGLLPTKRGCRGIDRLPCYRCQKTMVVYSRSDRWCHECKRVLRSRKTEYGRNDVAA